MYLYVFFNNVNKTQKNTNIKKLELKKKKKMLELNEVMAVGKN